MFLKIKHIHMCPLTGILLIAMVSQLIELEKVFSGRNFSVCSSQQKNRKKVNRKYEVLYGIFGPPPGIS